MLKWDPKSIHISERSGKHAESGSSNEVGGLYASIEEVLAQMLLFDVQPEAVPVSSRPAKAVLATDADGSPLLKDKQGKKIASRWLMPGEAFALGDMRIGCGMVYVGSNHGPKYRPNDEPSLINPTLSFDVDAMGDSTTELSARSYAAMDPGERAGYLLWLASGRRDPNVPAQYVDLFLLGLERRVFAELWNQTGSRDELTMIYVEIQSLIKLHDENESTLQRMLGLAEVLHLVSSDKPYYELTPPVAPTSPYYVPLTLRAAFAQLAADGKSVPGEWAASWLMHDWTIRLSASAKRCPEEFKDLFALRYSQTYVRGLRIRATRRRFLIYYRAAHPFLQTTMLNLGTLTEASPSEGQMKKLQLMARDCGQELASYSRFVNTNRARATSLEAQWLLPADLVGARIDARLATFAAEIKDRLKSQKVVLEDAVLFANRWSNDSGERLSKTSATRLVEFLERHGIGMEPDPRHARYNLRTLTHVALFQTTTGSRPAEQMLDTYALLVSIVSLFMRQGSTTAPDSVWRGSIDYLANTSEWLKPHQIRMEAYAKCLLARPELPKLTKAGVATVKEGLAIVHGIYDERDRLIEAEFTEPFEMTRTLAAVAAAGPGFSPPNMLLLQRIAKWAGEDVDVNAIAYAAGMEMRQNTQLSDLGPQPVSRRKRASSDYKLPPVPALPTSQGGLNHALIAARLAETQAVAHRLGEKLRDDEPAPESPAKSMTKPAAAPVHGSGLDGPHLSFAEKLGAREQWDRAAWRALAGDSGVMPESALDHVNEAALDRVGALVVEAEDEMLFVDIVLLKELLECQ